MRNNCEISDTAFSSFLFFSLYKKWENKSKEEIKWMRRKVGVEKRKKLTREKGKNDIKYMKVKKRE